MQKILQVMVSGNERGRGSLADMIEKRIREFIFSADAKLERFEIHTAELQANGFGQALLTVEYTPCEPRSIAKPKTEKEVKK